MRTALLASALLVSFSARAGLIVEYWGTIDNGSAIRAAGDPIHGILRVDVAHAPGDINPTFGFYPNTAWYRDPPFGPADPQPIGGFVSQDGVPVGDAVYLVEDSVTVRDGWGPNGPRLPSTSDSFWVTDFQTFGGTPQSPNYIELTVGATGAFDFVDGLGLVQEFDVRPDPNSGAAGGFLSYFIDGVGEQLTFITHRVSVKVCRP